MYKTYLKAIILSGVIQITIGLIQIIVGQSALTFFSPYELTENNVFQNTFTALRPNNLNIFECSSIFSENKTPKDLDR